MRPFEILLVALMVAGVVAVVLGIRLSRRAAALLGAAGALVYLLHVVLEGTRVQMGPLLLVFLLSFLVLYWRSRSLPDETDASPRSRLRRGLAGLGRFLVLPVAALLAGLFPAAFIVPSLPAPTGQHPVGVYDFVVRFDDRPEILTEDPNDVRELMVRVWYPANEKGVRTEGYLTREEGRAFASAAGSIAPGGGVLYGHAWLAETHSYRDAPLLSASGTSNKLPVLAFSHGYTSFLAQNTPLMEELASHGYVVFSLAHTYDGSSVFPDGRVVGFGEHIEKWVESSQGNVEQLMADMEVFIASEDPAARRAMLDKQRAQARSDKAAGIGVGVSWDVWVEDRLRFFDVLDELQTGQRTSPFAGRLDLDRIGLLGMSFGGATAAEVCHLALRCKAAVNLDGGHMYGFDSPLLDADIGKPLLMVYSTDLTSHSVPSADNPGDFQSHNDFHYEPLQTRGTRDDVVRIRIAGTSHLHLSDMSLMTRWVPGIASGIPGERVAEIMNRFTTAFFDEHLRGQPAPLLDGPSPEFPEVTFQSFGRPLTR